MQQFELEPPDEETQRALENMTRSAAMRPADQKYVRFYSRPKKNDEKSREEGRPVFEPVEYVEIFTPGDKDTIVDRPVRNIDRYAWADKYRAFRMGKSQESAGTPLSEWGGVTPERAIEYAHFKIKTVEQLAEVPDGNLPNLGMHARAEREKARGYIAVMKGNSPLAEMQAKNEALLKRLEALEAANTAKPVPAEVAPVEAAPSQGGVKPKRRAAKSAPAEQ